MCNGFTGLVIALATVGVMGCGSSNKQVAEPKSGGTSDSKNEPIKATITPASAADGAAPSVSPIYFDFDSYQIVETSKAELGQVADYMSKHTGSTVTISGHTDERGTTEYNLALGDQRAKAAHDYLVRLGIDPLRIKTISFGEERPAVQGSGEENWSKNRRDEFNTSGKDSPQTAK